MVFPSVQRTQFLLQMTLPTLLKAKTHLFQEQDLLLSDRLAILQERS